MKLSFIFINLIFDLLMENKEFKALSVTVESAIFQSD
jgi:hypothetical protein